MAKFLNLLGCTMARPVRVRVGRLSNEVVISPSRRGAALDRAVGCEAALQSGDDAPSEDPTTPSEDGTSPSEG